MVQLFEKNGLVCSLQLTKIGLVHFPFLINRFLYFILRVVRVDKSLNIADPGDDMIDEAIFESKCKLLKALGFEAWAYYK